MHMQLPITKFLNSIFGGVYQINDPLAVELLVFVILLTFFILVRMNLSADNPGAIQHFAEMIHEMVSDQAKGIIGHSYERYVPYALCVGIFILVCNLIGLIPNLVSPTQFPQVPLGMAFLTFVYYHFHGIREQGIKNYAKHFCGPVWDLPIIMIIFMAPLMLLIETVSHLARIMSLTIRLYANMYAGDKVTMAFFSLVPVGVPIIFLLLHTGVAFIQAFLFMLLTLIYVSLGVAHEEGHESHAAH